MEPVWFAEGERHEDLLTTRNGITSHFTFTLYSTLVTFKNTEATVVVNQPGAPVLTKLAANGWGQLCPPVGHLWLLVGEGRNETAIDSI